MPSRSPAAWWGQLKHTDSVVIALVAFMGAYGLVAIGIIPMMIGSWVNSLGINEQTAGFIGSTGFTGLTLGLVLAVLLRKRHTLMWIVAWGIGIAIVSDGASILVQAPVTLGAARFSAGIGYGLVEASVVIWFASHEQADRCFAVLMLLQLLLYPVLLVSIPALEISLGGTAAYIFLIGLGFISLLGLPLLKLNAHGRDRVPVENKRGYSGGNFAAIAIVLSPTLFLAGVVGFWAYLQLFGVSLGIPESQLGLAIAAVSLAGIPATLLVLWLRNRLGRALPVLLGIICTLAPLLIFRAGNTNFISFVAGGAIFNMGWCFTYPYMQAIQADLDRSGQLAAIATVPQSIGVAIGPAAFAIALTSGSFSSALALVITLLLLSLVGVILPALSVDRMALH